MGYADKSDYVSVVTAAWSSANRSIFAAECALRQGFDSETGEYPRALKANVYPVLRNHCKEAKCVDACPTRATQKREDGIVWVDSK
jgi:Fe-S-cluster-containing dehydrogenase component